MQGKKENKESSRKERKKSTKFSGTKIKVKN